MVSFATRTCPIFFAILSQSRSGRTSPSPLGDFSADRLIGEKTRKTMAKGGHREPDNQECWTMATEQRQETGPGLVQQIVRNLRRRNPELAAWKRNGTQEIP